MKKNILNVLSLILALMMIFSLVGCKNETTSPDDDAASNTSSSPSSSVSDEADNDSNEIECNDFVGFTMTDILELQVYKDKSLNFEFRYAPSEEYEANRVCAQSIPAGRTVKIGSTIILTISTGTVDIRIPDLSEMDEVTAISMLEAKGLKTTIIKVSSETVEAGKVIKTDPAVETIVSKGTVITIYVSTGSAE